MRTEPEIVGRYRLPLRGAIQERLMAMMNVILPRSW